MRTVAVFLPLACLVSAPLSAAEAVFDQEATDPAVAAPEKPKKVCRTIVKSESRMGAVKKCQTAEQWAEQDRLARTAVGRTRSDNSN